MIFNNEGNVVNKRVTETGTKILKLTCKLIDVLIKQENMSPVEMRALLNCLYAWVDDGIYYYKERKILSEENVNT